MGVAHALFLANELCSKESCSPSSQYKNSATTQQKKANEIRIPYRRVHITCHLGKAGRSVGAREKEGCSMLAAIFCICSALKLRSLPPLRATFARATRVLCSRQPGAPRRAPCAPSPCWPAPSPPPSRALCLPTTFACPLLAARCRGVCLFVSRALTSCPATMPAATLPVMPSRANAKSKIDRCTPCMRSTTAASSWSHSTTRWKSVRHSAPLLIFGVQQHRF